MATKDIKVFEMNNNISVNVLLVENREIYICRKGNKRDQEINLMLIHENERVHYTAVKSLSTLLRSSNTKHKCKQYFCTNCLQGFTQELSRDQHQVHCKDNETVRVEMPKKGSIVEIYDGQNQFRVPFIMYANFEALLKPMGLQGLGSLSDPIESNIPDPNQPYSQNVIQHIPSGYCVYSKFTYGEVKDPLATYRGTDCVEKFCDYIKQKAYQLYHMFPEKLMDPLTKKQWKRYEKATRCHICYRLLNSKDPKYNKVRDHCHCTGHYRGAAHLLCNLRY